MTFRRPRARTLVALITAALAAGALTSWIIGSQLVKPVNHAVPLPAGFPAKVVSIPGSGHAVAGWWVDRGDRSPVVLLLHAVRADRRSMIPRAKLLLDRGFSVLLIDLQGQGETPGASITFGLRESADVQAALKWIRRAARDRSVGVIGCSLGGAAVLLGPQPAGFDAVVLEAVYPRITDAVENRIRIRFGPLAPVLAPLLLAQLRLRSHIAPGDLEPIRSIATLGAPLLVVAGSRDQHTTIAESEALFGAAVQPKQIWVVNDARHQDFLAFDPAGYDATVVGFLREHLRLPMNETKLRDFARHYTAAWCSQDPARVASFFAETGCLKINEGSPSVGRTAVTAAAQSFMSAFPDMVVKMDGLSIEGGGVVYRWTLTGTNTGPGGTGRAVRISGYEEWTIGADGLIASSKGLFDDAGYQRQLKGE